MSDTPITFVRTEILGEKAPPTSEVGAVRWVRENLFSSPLNAVLTVISLYVVYTIISHVGPWLLNGIWRAESLTECREIIAATGDDHYSAACFGVISARWHQLLFGYYPSELYWRPVVALLVFLTGIAPVMFPTLSRKLYIVTLAAPLLCFWLLWGGSIWFPVAIALGFGIGAVAHKLLDEYVSSLAAIIGAIILPLIYWLYASGPIAAGLDGIIPLGIEFVPSRSFGGFMLSIVIGLSAIVISLPLGILLALARRSDLFIIKTCAVVFIEVIRGIPLIVWLFTAQLLLNYFLPPGSSFDLTLRVIIMVTLFASAYIAEVIRGGLAALPKGQYEGADSLGLNYWQSMQLIVLPQALKISIPGIVNTFIGLFKDTTLVVFIGLFDPLGIASAIRATTEWNGIYWELFLFIGIMFFISCFSMGRYSLYLEKKLQRENR